MKLKQLVSCNTYRDGGSLEATWLTAEQNPWSATLHVKSWSDPKEIKTYRLYNCKLTEKTAHQPIEKNSPEHKRIVDAIEEWVLANQSALQEVEKDPYSFNSIPHFLEELRKGNY